jgi:polysaccharide biosynthesis/export protein
MRLLRMEMRRYLGALCPLALVLMLTACQSPPPPDPKPTQPSPEEVEKILHSEPLQVGDKVSVELTGIPDKMDPLLRDIKEDGTINLPFINNIPAAGKTPSQLEKDIKTEYEPHWYPHVNVTVTPVARFFYVMGQVTGGSGSGRVAYTGPITVLGAITSAGDFTPFADKKHVQITRMNGKIEYVNCVKALKHPELDLKVFPGDKIMVPRRLY